MCIIIVLSLVIIIHIYIYMYIHNYIHIIYNHCHNHHEHCWPFHLVPPRHRCAAVVRRRGPSAPTCDRPPPGCRRRAAPGSARSRWVPRCFSQWHWGRRSEVDIVHLNERIPGLGWKWMYVDGNVWQWMVQWMEMLRSQLKRRSWGCFTYTLCSKSIKQCLPGASWWFRMVCDLDGQDSGGRRCWRQATTASHWLMTGCTKQRLGR